MLVTLVLSSNVVDTNLHHGRYDEAEGECDPHHLVSSSVLHARAGARANQHQQQRAHQLRGQAPPDRLRVCDVIDPDHLLRVCNKSTCLIV